MTTKLAFYQNDLLNNHAQGSETTLLEQKSFAMEDTIATMKWPKEARVAVCLSGDIDRAWDLANGNLERILEVLDDFEVKYTFPVSGQVFFEDPDCVEQIISHGDEIAGHGDVHEGFRGQSYAQQRKRMEEMMRIIREFSGIKINGFRAPDVNMDTITLKVADELGLSYDSSHEIGEAILVNFRGRFIEIRSKALRRVISDSIDFVKGHSRRFTRIAYKGVGIFGSKEEECLPFNPIFEGQRLGILEIPVSHLEDSGLIEEARIRNWKKIAEIWKRNFDYYYGKNGLYVLEAHPRRIGRKEYIGALKSLIEYAIGQNDVWFTTLTELATWCKKELCVAQMELSSKTEMIAMPQHHFGKDYFEGSRSPYGSYLGKRERRLKEAAIYLEHLMKYISQGRLLEVGCAYGFYLEVFREEFEVFGMDISEHAIQQAKRFLPEVRDHIVRHDCQEKWPYVDNYFDVVVAYYVIEYLKYPLNMIKETYRCLKPGGVFMFLTANALYEILPRLFPHLFYDVVLLKYKSLTNVTPYLKYPWELKSLLSDFLILEKIERPWIGKLKILENNFRLPIRATIGKLPIFNSRLTWICRSKKTKSSLPSLHY